MFPMPVWAGFAGAGVAGVREAVVRFTFVPRVRPLFAADPDTATIFIGRTMSLSSWSRM
jgi:hypothetical protein